MPVHFYKKKKKTPWPLVRKRTIPTERPPLVEFNFYDTLKYINIDKIVSFHVFPISSILFLLLTILISFVILCFIFVSLIHYFVLFLSLL
jgi:hypothetical protein